MKRPLVARRSPVLLGASRPILLETVVLFVMAILIREQLPYTSSSASKSNAMNDSIMVVNAMSTASARTTRRGTTSPSMPLPLPVPEPVPEPVPVRSAQDHHAVIPPPRLPLTPPFPNGLCGGTIVDIAPEETFGVDVNLANFNFMGDMVLLPRTIQIWLPPGYEDGDNSNNNNNGNGNDASNDGNDNDNDTEPTMSALHSGGDEHSTRVLLFPLNSPPMIRRKLRYTATTSNCQGKKKKKDVDDENGENSCSRIGRGVEETTNNEKGSNHVQVHGTRFSLTTPPSLISSSSSRNQNTKRVSLSPFLDDSESSSSSSSSPQQ
mmetsp:Transcript_18280/g.38085  ORF Transcript_18280/g.38085 Transcript_18280/m.38085 type:complete len:322 (-) Transcript_18280:1212-2177(-)